MSAQSAAATKFATPQTQTGAEIISVFRDSATPENAAKRALLYIHNAVPVKGATVDADGKCHYLLQCFAMPLGMTPGQVRDTQFHPREAQYRAYYGHISRARHETGIVIGYVHDCDVTHSVKDARHQLLPRPQIAYDTSTPRYGDCNHMIESFDGQIAIEKTIEAIRNPKPQLRTYRPRCIGG